MADIKQVEVPDIGGATDVEVIEILVSPGDEVAENDSLITLESDKASMDIPSPGAGIVKELKVSLGSKVSEGSPILTLEVTSAGAASQTEAPKEKEPSEVSTPEVAPSETSSLLTRDDSEEAATRSADGIYAGPAVRRIAREFGIELNQIKGTGRKGRIVKEDVQNFVKALMKGAPAAGGLAIGAAPAVDFSQFGEIESQPLSRIKKLSGANLHRNWVSIPHVTQFDEADITELEAFRKAQKTVAEKQGFKLTPLVFIMKAVVGAMRMYPIFNSSLDASGENLIMKKYCHLGIAVDTPDGLMVPVVRDVDKKGLFELAKELGEISERARNKKLTAKDMQGSCFTISSLGGIGGTAFTPIINAPDVAILGVSRSYMKPVHKDGEFVPRLTLPLSLSYDHRVVDGADGARFSQQLVAVLSDIRKILL